MQRGFVETAECRALSTNKKKRLIFAIIFKVSFVLRSYDFTGLNDVSELMAPPQRRRGADDVVLA